MNTKQPPVWKNYLTTIGMVVGISSAIVSPFIALGTAKAELQQNISKAEENSKSIKILWDNVTADRVVLTKHEALIPVIQQDIQEMKETQQDMARDIRLLLIESERKINRRESTT